MRSLRRIVPGSVYLITRKCIDDRFVIVPSASVNSILKFCLFVSAKKYGIALHAFCFMSNHFHLVVTDREGKLPDFMSHFLSNSAKALRCCLGVGAVWGPDRYSAVECLDLDAACRKITYTLLNPVRAGLCSEPALWPGVTSAGTSFGTEMLCQRPQAYYSARKTAMPDAVRCVLEPVEVSFCSTSTEVSEVRRQLEHELAEVQQEHQREKRQYPTVEKIRSQSRSERSSRPVRTRNPRFATRDRDRLEGAIATARAFKDAHDLAKKKYVNGETQVVFPLGTYGYRRVLGVSVECAAA